jgi:hypothetical protein
MKTGCRFNHEASVVITAELVTQQGSQLSDSVGMFAGGIVPQLRSYGQALQHFDASQEEFSLSHLPLQGRLSPLEMNSGWINRMDFVPESIQVKLKVLQGVRLLRLPVHFDHFT